MKLTAAVRIVYIFIAILLSTYLAGCSLPVCSLQDNLSSFSRSEHTKKSGFIGKTKIVTIKDFRGKSASKEDVEKYKKSVEEYIAIRPGLPQETINNLRELKVTRGLTLEEVGMLLGRPDKKRKLGKGARYGSEELWIYKIGKLRAFTIFIFPVFFPHDAYYLYFKKGALAGIEKRYLEQTIRQSEGPGVTERKTGI